MCLAVLYTPPPRPLPRLDYFEELVPLSSASYPGYYAALARLEKPFSPADAYRLCLEALQARLTPRAIAALLDHCPPPEEFCVSRPSWSPLYDPYRTLLDEACRYGRADVVDQLLRRGADPMSRAAEQQASPLIYAVCRGSVSCTRRLLQEERLDTAMTYSLLVLWAHPRAAGRDRAASRRCLRLAAPRLTGMEYPRRGPIPLLPQLEPAHAAAANNYPLFRRICQARGGLTAEEGEDVLEQFSDHFDPWYQYPQLPELLDLLLTLCPALLGSEAVRQALLLCRLAGPLGREVLDPWLARLPGGQIPLWDGVNLCALDWLESDGEEGLLSRWKNLPGPTAAPVLDRNAPLPLSWNKAEGAAQLLRLCPVQGSPPKGELSALARDVLDTADEGLVREQLEEGGFLTREDQRALVSFCTGPDCPPRLAGLILAHIGPVAPEGNYAL